MEELFSGHGWRVTMEEAPLPDGRVKMIARVHRPDSSHILAFDEAGNILILREYRPFYSDYIWMLPSGRVDKETDMHEAAQRELREETGLRAAEMKHLWTVHHSESMAFANHIFLARDLIEDPLDQDHDEWIEVHRFPAEEALEKILGSPIVHLPSAYALLRYLREKEEI